MKSIKRLLVANRGEIACRVFRTCENMGIEGIAVFTQTDSGMPHTLSRESHFVSSYLSMDEIIAAAKKSKADGIHPGYGFLAENPAFARACAKNDLTWIGPSPEAMAAIGDKSKAREQAKVLGIPVSDGFGPFEEPKEIEKAAKDLGAPLMLKAAAGGGGKGMKKLLSLEGIAQQIETAQRETGAAFGDKRMIVERYIEPARHIEVQIFGDGKRAIALGERECSLQRRHQKIIEESPSPAVDEALRSQLFDSAVRLVESVGYKNAGTVEFLLGPNNKFYFLEVNARLQVEHPVTEMCTGLDLVKMQIEIATGGELMQQEDVKRKGHAIEARLNAEDPYNNFLPSAGRILKRHLESPWTRVDTGLGNTVSTAYDSLIAKVISHSHSREEARTRLISGLKSIVILGIYSNQQFLMSILESDWFAKGETFTSTIDSLDMIVRELPEPLKLAAAVLLRGPQRDVDDRWAMPWSLH